MCNMCIMVNEVTLEVLAQATAAVATLRRARHEEEADAVQQLVSLASKRKFWTVGRAATEIGIHRNTLRNWASSGRIKAYRRAGSDEILVPDEEVRRLLTVHALHEEVGSLDKIEIEDVLKHRPATVVTDVLDSPLGPLWVAITAKGVAAIHYGTQAPEGELLRLIRVYGPNVVPDARRSAALARELNQYFKGKRRTFDIPVDLKGLTPFQTRVLAQTAKIPFGELITYRTLATLIGNTKASRAVGGAVGANPIPIIVPCHRVIATDGSLGGYAGGLEAKRKLLAIERPGAIPAGGWEPAHRMA